MLCFGKLDRMRTMIPPRRGPRPAVQDLPVLPVADEAVAGSSDREERSPAGEER